ncbi:transglutaminase-like putative cysteine protease [Methylohalomonas lacus]|uniref:Transglutaminase-like putative cysteine protease n=1 Tax=Methylohalomonas lacus TaxID=398773 RepID=A0AAE3HJD8_9GAMM|nr:transglutaminase family protein [Methylohalomonas lacus]MCS3903375.1 transglutaminase-like putative cysteine protease [Methylohalomonas lacus]
MQRFNLGARLQYRTFEPATFVFNIAVAENDHQKVVSEDIRLLPELDFEQHVYEPGDSRYLRVNVPTAGSFEIDYRATVESTPYYSTAPVIAEVPHAVMPLDVLTYLYPSRYCESDRLMRLAELQFGYLLPGYSRVQGICNWIYDNVVYLSGSTSSGTSAFNTVTERAGVCRDFAHLGIAFCRALGVPARFVTGYVVGLNPPDFHAAFEVYLEDRWYLFDATRLVSLDQFIRVGTGHDAADVSFATIFGPVEMTWMELFINGEADSDTDMATTAISTIAI